MTLSIQCPGCSQGYRVPDEAAGRSTRCRKCGTTIQIPAGSLEPTVAYSAAPPAPAAVSFAEAPPLPSVRTARRSKVGLIAAASVVAVVFLLGGYVAARWFLGGATLGNAEKYLPDKCDAIGVANIEQFMNSKLYAELEKTLPISQQAQYVDVKNVRRVVGGGSTVENTGITIYETRSPITGAELQANVKKKETWIKDFKEEKIGGHTVYRYSARPRFEIRNGKAVPREQPEYGEAFCVPENNIALIGKYDVIKKVLERGGAPELSSEFRAAMKEVDFSSTLAFAAILNKVPEPEKGAIQLLPGVNEQLKQVERVAGQIKVEDGLDIHLVVQCREAAKAKEFHDLANGGLAMVKTMGNVPPDALKVLEAVKLKNDGKLIIGDLKIDQDLLLKAVKSGAGVNRGGAFKAN